MKLYNLLWSKWYRAKCDLAEWVAKHAPKIRTRKPEPPAQLCDVCHKPYTRIIAVYTGEGWALEWECDNGCGWCVPLEDWWPFMFGAYCGWRDLERAGIEVV
jgi:hypothetical protein